MRTVVPDLISTIIPVYNRPDLLREAVGSVLAQSWRPIEIIVIDDGSTDGTADVADRLAADHPGTVFPIHRENAGPGLAREAGRSSARGEFIQYLDSDDLLLPRKFELQVEALRQHPECGAAYGWTRYRHSDGRVEKGPWKDSGKEVAAMFPAMLRSRWWDTPTPLYRRDVCDAAGPWTGLRLEEDWEYDCRIAALGVRLCRVDEYVAEVRDLADNRLCRGTSRDPFRMRERARAHTLILQHAETAGISPEVPEMRHFARELFLLCRQCGAAGLPGEAAALFALARRASGPVRGSAPEFHLYSLLARLFGWVAAGRFFCAIDRVRPK